MDAEQPHETFQLGPFTVPRLFNGLWQLSSNAWGSAPSPKIRRQMAHYAAKGYTAFGQYVSLLAMFFQADIDARHGEFCAQPTSDVSDIAAVWAHPLPVTGYARTRSSAQIRGR